MPAVSVTGAFTFNFSVSTLNVTATHTSGVLLVGIWYVEGAGHPDTVEWDSAGVSEDMTLLKRQRDAISTGRAVDWWVLLNPTFGSSKNILITNTASISLGAAAFSVTSCNSSSLAAFTRDTTLTGDTANNFSSVALVSVDNTEATDLVIDIVIGAGTLTQGADQTVLINTNDLGGPTASSWKSGADGGNFSWARDGGANMDWVIAALGILAVSGGGDGFLLVAN